MTNWKRVNWRLAGIVAAAALVIWIAAEVIIAGNAPPLPPTTQQITLKGGTLKGNHIKTKSWTFSFDNASMSPDGMLATVNGIHNGVLYKKGKPYLSIKAQEVSINTQSLDFTALGDVHVETIAPKDHVKRSFDTDLVQWVNATKMLNLMHPSIVRTGDQTLKAATITVNFNTGDITFGALSGGVKVK